MIFTKLIRKCHDFFVIVYKFCEIWMRSLNECKVFSLRCLTIHFSAIVNNNKSTRAEVGIQYIQKHSEWIPLENWQFRCGEFPMLGMILWNAMCCHLSNQKWFNHFRYKQKWIQSYRCWFVATLLLLLYLDNSQLKWCDFP